MLGLSLPTKNFALCKILYKYVLHFQTLGLVSFEKVQAHVGIEGNERADSLAKKGAQSSSYAPLGRFETTVPIGLSIPPFPSLPNSFTSLPLEEKYSYLKQVLDSSAESSFEQKKFPTRPTYFSDSTNALIDKYCSFIGSSSFTHPTKHHLHRQIKKSIRKDRKSKLTQDLEIDSRSGPAERWCKLKQLRSKYTPCPPCI